MFTTKDEVDAYNRIVAGDLGEMTVIEYLKRYGKRHWVAVPNLWMSHFGTFECDVLLFTQHKIYVFEVKNYYGDFIYENGRCLLNSYPLNVDPVFQARRASSNIQEILNKKSISSAVEGSILFTGVDNYIDFRSEVSDLQIVPRNHLVHFIQEIIAEESHYTGPKNDWKKIVSVLSRFESQNSFLPVPYSKNELLHAKTGIFCAECQSYKIKVEKNMIQCARCAHQEDRQKAVIRTVLEYEVLTYNQNFTVSELLAFFGGQISRSYLTRILRQHFKKVNNNRYTNYQSQRFSTLKSL